VQGIGRRWPGHEGFGRRRSTTQPVEEQEPLLVHTDTLLIAEEQGYVRELLPVGQPSPYSPSQPAAPDPAQGAARGWMWIFARKTPPASAPRGIRVPVAAGRRDRTTRPPAYAPPGRTGRGRRLARRREPRPQDEAGGNLQNLRYTDGLYVPCTAHRWEVVYMISILAYRQKYRQSPQTERSSVNYLILCMESKINYKCNCVYYCVTRLVLFNCICVDLTLISKFKVSNSICWDSKQRSKSSCWQAEEHLLSLSVPATTLCLLLLPVPT
jgi:hypothetical protein